MKVEIKDEIGIFKNNSFDLELEEGLTILTGCNGAGKSTLSKSIKKFLEGKTPCATAYNRMVRKYGSGGGLLWQSQSVGMRKLARKRK